MNPAEKLAAIQKIMEDNLPVGISKAGSLKACYLIITDGREYKWPNRGRKIKQKRGGTQKRDAKIIVSSAYLKARFGITA